MKKQNLSLWDSVSCRFASVLLILLSLAVPDSAVKAQTTPQHEFSVSLSDVSATEGNSGSNIVATGTVSVSNPTLLNFGVNVFICFTGTATEGTDYTLIAQNSTNRITFQSLSDVDCSGGNLLIPFSSSTTSWSLRIQVNSDGTIENDEAIIISVIKVVPSLLGVGNDSKVGISSTAGSVTFTIENDDSHMANFAAASSSADEDDGTITVAVNLSENATMNTDVAYSVSGTATSTTDFAALSNTVQITSGSNTANISIPIIDDEADESNETIILTLSDSFGYKVGTPNIHTLTINDDDASPMIKSLNTARVAEGTTRVLTVTAMDDDNDDLTYSITAGVDSAQFSIDQSTGDLTFKIAPDFETPRSADNDNVYEVIVTASDGTNNTAQTITVTVTNVNDNDPMLAPTAIKSVAENTTDVLTVTATDDDAGTTLTYSITAGADSAQFSIDQSSGALAFKTAPDFESASADGDDDYEVIVTVSDGTNSTMQTITVTVTDVNEAPFIAVQTFSVTENAVAGTTVGTVAATDKDAGNNLNFSITSGNTGQAFTINAGTGEITVAGSLDHETTPTYTLTVQVSDGDLSASAAVTINVTNVNDNDPMLAPTATASVAENTTAVLTVMATDADAGTTLRYSISGGADQALFSINNSGALTFMRAPDFEMPTDQDRDNEYIVEVTATDGTNSAMQTITVTVTDDPSDDSDDDPLGFSADEEAAVIFPNPSGDYLEVRSTTRGTFQILSLSGKSLLEGSTNTKVDITSLRSGLYLIQLPDGHLLKFVRE